MDTKSNNLNQIRGVMNLLSREECIKALDCLADDDKMDELAQNFSMDDDYTSHVNYEMARKWCYDQLKQCIDERFDNPALRFEELKQGMWIWDNARKEWVKVEAQRETYTKIVECWVIGWALLKTYEFEPNRFYRKEVQE